MRGYHPPMDIKDELVRYFRWLRQYGLNDSHSGNASVRDGDVVWVTPTGCCADTLRPEELVACTLEDGPGPGASMDAPLHLASYTADPAARALLHSHGPASIALTLSGNNFHAQDFEGCYHFPDGVAVVDAGYDDYLARSPALVSAALAHGRICIYRGHGVYASGSRIDLAYKWTCSLEHSARIASLVPRP